MYFLFPHIFSIRILVYVLRGYGRGKAKDGPVLAPYRGRVWRSGDICHSIPESEGSAFCSVFTQGWSTRYHFDRRADKPHAQSSLFVLWDDARPPFDCTQDIPYLLDCQQNFFSFQIMGPNDLSIFLQHTLQKFPDISSLFSEMSKFRQNSNLSSKCGTFYSCKFVSGSLSQQHILNYVHFPRSFRIVHKVCNNTLLNEEAMNWKVYEGIRDGIFRRNFPPFTWRYRYMRRKG